MLSEYFYMYYIDGACEVFGCIVIILRGVRLLRGVLYDETLDYSSIHHLAVIFLRWRHRH